MSLAEALRLSDQGRYREACALLEPVVAAGGEEASVAAAYLVGWSVHVPGRGSASAAARAVANENGASKSVLALELVTRRGWRGRVDGAARLLERAIPKIAGGLSPNRRARMFGYAAMFQLAGGELDRAREHAERALEMSTALGDRRWMAFAEAALALVALERGRPRDAERRLRQARVHAAGVTDVMLPASLGLIEGELATALGDRDRAVAAYSRAVVASDGRHGFMAPWAWASVCAAQADRGRLEEARFALARARRGARSLNPITRAAVELRAHHLAIAEERPGARLAAERALREAEPQPALRRWRQALAESCRARSTVLTVGPDAAWFRVDGGRRVSLARSPTQRRLLRALLARRAAGEGSAVAKHLLDGMGIEAACADEHQRAVARVHAATVRLRRAGLGPLLVFDGEGLAFGSRVFIEREPQ